MTFGQLFFGFAGRISRRTYILSIIGVFIVSFIFGLILTFATTWRQDWISVVTTILFFWPGVALGIKRAHDRQRSAAWYVISVVGILLLQFGSAAAVGIPIDRIQIWPWWAIVLALLSFLWSLWLLIELVFLRGTYGENRYGPDPINPV